jgi:co-chaperonin GroES (HSP10)
VSSHPQDTYVTPDGTKIRILGNRLLVQIDEPPSVSANGLILYPSGAMEHANNTGTILAFGTIWKGAERIPIPGLEVGQKIVFVRFLAEQHTNKNIRHTLGKDLIQLAPSDVQLMYDPSEHDKILR